MGLLHVSIGDKIIAIVYCLDNYVVLGYKIVYDKVLHRYGVLWCLLELYDYKGCKEHFLPLELAYPAVHAEDCRLPSFCGHQMVWTYEFKFRNFSDNVL